MSNKDVLQHHVHFGEVDNFEKNNDIVFEYNLIEKGGKLTVHLGFLQIRHLYRIELKLPRAICRLEPERSLISISENIPNLYINLLDIQSFPDYFEINLELFAHKENLIKETIEVIKTDTNMIIQMCLIARVLGKGKGTPLLRNGIKSIQVEPDDESEASDWQGFTND